MLGIIGGSGIYQLEGLKGQGEERPRWRALTSPFGEPSDELCFASYDGAPVVFLPRHGRGHTVSPTEINYRANIDVLKRAGVTEIVSLSAVGSLREALAPGRFVLVDQYMDRTFARPKSFFENGVVAHVSMAHPVCRRLGESITRAARVAEIELEPRGTYLAMEGPQFSTAFESKCYRSWGCDVIGMTNMPEAKLAREAELCYASVAMVTDYDAWREGHEAVTVEQILTVLKDNAARAGELMKALIPRTDDRQGGACSSGCDRALEYAILTPKGERDPAATARLEAILKRVDGAG